MISPSEILLRYSTPLVTSSAERRSQRGESLKASSHLSTDSSPVRHPKSKSATSEATIQHEEDILNAMLPPREWMERNQQLVQHVSCAPSSRTDLLHLEEQLDKKLQQRQARQTGICPVRSEIYSQLFDELIRQVTINCAERGLLLLRVRDEIQMTIAAYQTLYESSVPFGLRKAVQSVHEHTSMEERISELETEREDLLKQVETEKAKYAACEKREIERRQLEETKHTAEVKRLKKSNQQIQDQLRRIIAPRK